MTIKLLAAYDIYPQNAIVTLAAGTESGLIAARLATATLTGGVTYVAPAAPPVINVARISTLGGVSTIIDDAGNTVAVGGGGGGTTAVATLLANVALPARSLVCILSNGKLGLADATAEGAEAIGFVSAAVLSGALATVYVSGNVLSGLSGLVAGGRYCMSTTAGGIVTAATAGAYTTGRVFLPVGTAISLTELLFVVGSPITL
jgi:hypothetical protein